MAIEDTINKSNEAMLAATSKARGGKGKEKGKQTNSKCSNCNKPNHTVDKCWMKGVGQEGKAPEWWLKKQKNVKAKKYKKGKSVNSTGKASQSDSESDNYAMLNFTLPKNPSALICTSDFKHEAHTVTKSNGMILNCGAGSHFTPEHSKLLNYREITPEPICSADGHTLSATEKGDLKLELPNGNQKLTPVTLKNVYYSPHLAFTPMSVGIMDQNRYNVCIKEGKWVI